MKKSLYDVLGVDKKSKTIKDDVKRNYRKKAKEKHPDKGGSATEFSQLSIAYKVLSDDHLREEYDRTGSYTSDQPNLESICIERIEGILMQMLTQRGEEFEHFDWIKEIIQQCRDAKQTCLKANLRLNDQEICLQKIVKNIKYKGKGRNLLTFFIEEKIQLINRAIHSNKKEMEVAERCVDILSDYSLAKVSPFTYASIFEVGVIK